MGELRNQNWLRYTFLSEIYSGDTHRRDPQNDQKHQEPSGFIRSFIIPGVIFGSPTGPRREHFPVRSPPMQIIANPFACCFLALHVTFGRCMLLFGAACCFWLALHVAAWHCMLKYKPISAVLMGASPSRAFELWKRVVVLGLLIEPTGGPLKGVNMPFPTV